MTDATSAPVVEYIAPALVRVPVKNTMSHRHAIMVRAAEVAAIRLALSVRVLGDSTDPLLFFLAPGIEKCFESV